MLARDDANENIGRHFNSTCTFIKQAISSGGCVLVHCFSGLNLSPAFVMAYLIKERKITTKKAFKVISKTQKTSKPFTQFMFQL